MTWATVGPQRNPKRWIYRLCLALAVGFSLLGAVEPASWKADRARRRAPRTGLPRPAAARGAPPPAAARWGAPHGRPTGRGCALWGLPSPRRRRTRPSG